MITNIHRRRLPISAFHARRLIDDLGSSSDVLWPQEAWPAMRFDRPLAVGAVGGHGPIRYSVVEYVPGEAVVFQFTAPRGFVGTHRFDLIALPTGCELRHTLAMRVRGPAILTWPLVFRWMHDALLEDAMAKAQNHVGDAPEVVPWSGFVRLLRRVVSKGRPRPQPAWNRGGGQ